VIECSGDLHVLRRGADPFDESRTCACPLAVQLFRSLAEPTAFVVKVPVTAPRTCRPDGSQDCEHS